MRLLTPLQIKRVEEAFWAGGHGTESGMIASAGRAAAELAEARFGPLTGSLVVVLCGKGHNAADGLVAALRWLEAGVRVSAFLAFPREALAVETAKALDKALAAGLQVVEDLALLEPGALAVDAMVGTGARLPLQGRLADCARWINAQAAPVLALDLPSGLDGETGAVHDPCVKAAATISFVAAKPGLFLDPGRDQAGMVQVHAFSAELRRLVETESTLRAFDLDEARAALPLRRGDAHKKQARLLIVAGSVDYLGAALLCAKAAYRGGAGLVRLALPRSLALAAVSALPEAVVLGLPAEDALDDSQRDALLGALAESDALVVGPGLGRRPGTQDLVRALWRETALPALFDADALHALRLAQPAGAVRVLTPHAGELKALMGPGALADGRCAAALALARATGAVALLKGPATLVARPDGQLSINVTGSAVLASAGTGDVLSGLIGALLAQAAAAHQAAGLGAWAHGAAADAWARENAGRGLLASDLLERLPQALALAGA